MKKITIRLDETFFEACEAAARSEMMDLQTWIRRRMAGLEAKAPSKGTQPAIIKSQSLPKEVVSVPHEVVPKVENPKIESQSVPHEVSVSTPLLDKYKAQRAALDAPRQETMAEVFKRVGEAKPGPSDA